MAKQSELREQVSSIETLVLKLEEASDPLVRSAARDLVQAVMELHGAGIERMLQIAREAGDPGSVIIERFGQDEIVRSVLLLYGLHPLDLKTRTLQALDNLRSFLTSHGASAELVSIDEAGALMVNFQMKSGGCGSTAASVKSRIQAALRDAAPDASSILVADKSVASFVGSAFVPVSELQNSRAMAGLSVRNAQRSGD